MKLLYMKLYLGIHTLCYEIVLLQLLSLYKTQKY